MAKNKEADDDHYSENTAINDIILWSENRPRWQRDALRRLYINTDLTDLDIDELYQICKDENSSFEPISIEHLRTKDSSAQAVALKAIYDVTNVNALANEQRLQFCPTGINIIYGDNGAGKSGYVRILKKICRARDKSDQQILGNIYQNTGVPQSANISYSIDGRGNEIKWVAGQTSPSILTLVSVFDSHSANVHVNATNDVAYVPFPVDVLQKLAEACKKIKDKLNAEIELLNSKGFQSLINSKSNNQTKVGQFIKNLTHKSKSEDTNNLKLSDLEKKRLNEVRIDLNTDPSLHEKKLRYHLERINSIISQCKKSVLAVSDEQTNALYGLHEEYKLCQEASHFAASSLFTNDPLPNVGGQAWRMLWNAAKQYSTTDVYCEMTFPVIEDEARCVLCQQHLSSDAKDRMNRFERYITDATTANESRAYEAYLKQKELINTGVPTIHEIGEIINFCIGEIGSADVAAQIKRFFITIKWRARAILRLSKNLPEFEFWPEDILVAETKALAERINSLADNTAENHRALLSKEKNELEDREWLESAVDDLIKIIQHKQSVFKLDSLIKSDAATQNITLKNTEISEKLITNTLRARFAKEIDNMHLSGLAVELKQDTSKHGAPQFIISLIQSPSSKVGNILSEGEFRCIAIAAFFTELVTSKSKSGIVFDDPISSLDHIHREAVAKRLAEESLHRQVIVFTHDLYFLHLLANACSEVSTKVTYKHITKRPDLTATGICHDGAPPKAKDVNERIKSMKAQLKNKRYHYDNGNESEWNVFVRSISDDIRYTWERAVEEVVGVVLSRFSNKVDTKGMLKLTAITERDCTVMREAFSRNSSWLHSDAVALNRNLLKPEEIDHELDVLSSWHDELLKRQQQIK